MATAGCRIVFYQGPRGTQQHWVTQAEQFSFGSCTAQQRNRIEQLLPLGCRPEPGQPSELTEVPAWPPRGRRHGQAVPCQSCLLAPELSRVGLGDG